MTACCESITTVKHPALRRARALATRSGRARARRFMIEGEGMIRQALAADVAVGEVFFLDDTQVEAPLRASLAQAGANCYSLSRGLMTKLLGTGYDTSVTAAAVVPMHLAAVDAIAAAGGPLLVCERIQDPRNVGVLLRTAEAGAARGIILSADCAEPFSRAAVRSSTGSILRLELAISDDLAGDLARLRDAGLRVIATSARGRTSIHHARLGLDCAIIVGNESDGVSAPVQQAADEVVAIPVAGGASSFNVTVAAGILLYECGRGQAARRG